MRGTSSKVAPLYLPAIAPGISGGKFVLEFKKAQENQEREIA
jgi:hypothetical protein